MRRTWYAVLALAMSVTLSACADDGPATPGTDAAAPTSSTRQTEDPVQSSDHTPITPKPTTPHSTQLPITPSTPPGDLPVGPVPERVKDREDVQAAVQDQAKRAGVEASRVEVAGYADVTWHDGSIGCPQPGMMYTQALVPGHQLILRIDGRLFSYHAAQGQPFSYCANPVPPTGGGHATS